MFNILKKSIDFIFFGALSGQILCIWSLMLVVLRSSNMNRTIGHQTIRMYTKAHFFTGKMLRKERKACTQKKMKGIFKISYPSIEISLNTKIKKFSDSSGQDRHLGLLLIGLLKIFCKRISRCRTIISKNHKDKNIKKAKSQTTQWGWYPSRKRRVKDENKS